MVSTRVTSPSARRKAGMRPTEPRLVRRRTSRLWNARGTIEPGMCASARIEYLTLRIWSLRAWSRLFVELMERDLDLA